MKESQINNLLHGSGTIYVQRSERLMVSNDHWCIYDDRVSSAIVSKIAPPDLVTHSEHSVTFRRKAATRWELSRKRGPDLREPLEAFHAASEALRVLDVEDMGIILRDRYAQRWRDVVVLSDGESLRFAERTIYDVLTDLFPGVGMAAEKEWHAAQQLPIVFHDYGDVVAILSSTVYTGTATRHIYPDPKRRAVISQPASVG